ncbi:MAG TPA: hypothetical protein VM327_05555 [Candidatus Thermoplasmatota archaeon]|nr:hypothetical protein [Candidatus Thermoplasmatota archaeon]
MVARPLDDDPEDDESDGTVYDQLAQFGTALPVRFLEHDGMQLSNAPPATVEWCVGPTRLAQPGLCARNWPCTTAISKCQACAKDFCSTHLEKHRHPTLGCRSERVEHLPGACALRCHTVTSQCHRCGWTYCESHSALHVGRAHFPKDAWLGCLDSLEEQLWTAASKERDGQRHRFEFRCTVDDRMRKFRAAKRARKTTARKPR